MTSLCPEVFIRPVERKLFAYLYAHKIATRRQILRDIFPDLSAITVRKRLKKLRRLGYLRADIHNDAGRWLVYSLTPTAFSEYVSPDLDLRRELTSEAVSHDLDLVDIAHYLKQSPRVQGYYPENLIASGLYTGGGDGERGSLRPFMDLRSDAAIDLAFDAGRYLFAVEYEATLKKKPRYKATFEKYAAASAIPVVLYVCRDAGIQARLEAYETEFLSDSVAKIFYATLDDLKQKMAPAFTNRKGEVLRLGTAFAA